MASQIDISALTLNEEEASSMAQLIMEREFIEGEISRDHDVQTGILYKEQIPFVGQMADSLKKTTGCTPNTGSGIALTEKFWDPEIIDSRWIHCAADLNKLFKLFQKEKRINPDYFDKSGSEEMGMIYALIAQMMRSALPTKIWFSDKAADDVDGSGVFTSGADLDLYNIIDGLFKQIFAEITPGSAYHVNVAANEGNSYANQAITPANAFATFENMLLTADERLISDPGAKFLATRSLTDAYATHLRANKLSNGFYETGADGRARLMFDGVPIETRYDWDRNIKALQDSGTLWNLPHRAVLSVKENLPVGTLNTSDMETLDSFYDRTLKSNIVDVALSIDAKHLEDYRTVVAY